MLLTGCLYYKMNSTMISLEYFWNFLFPLASIRYSTNIRRYLASISPPMKMIPGPTWSVRHNSICHSISVKYRSDFHCLENWNPEATRAILWTCPKLSAPLAVILLLLLIHHLYFHFNYHWYLYLYLSFSRRHYFACYLFDRLANRAAARHSYLNCCYH